MDKEGAMETMREIADNAVRIRAVRRVVQDMRHASQRSQDLELSRWADLVDVALEARA